MGHGGDGDGLLLQSCFVVAETEERELNAFDPEMAFIDEWYYNISLCLRSQLLSYEFVFTITSYRVMNIDTWRHRA